MKKNSVLILIVIFFSCQSQINKQENGLKQPYEYTEDFNYYFKENFKMSLFDLNKEKLFVVPVSSCTPCVDMVLNNLENNECNNCAALFVGQPDNERQNQINRIVNNITAFYDEKSDLYSYQTDVGKPCVLFIERGNVEKMKLDYADNEKTKAILNWK